MKLRNSCVMWPQGDTQVEMLDLVVFQLCEYVTLQLLPVTIMTTSGKAPLTINGDPLAPLESAS